MSFRVLDKPSRDMGMTPRDDKVILKVGSNTSSSAVSSPEEKCNGTTNSPESLQDFVGSKNEHDICSSFVKDKKKLGLSKYKMSEQKINISKGSKNMESKNASTNDLAFTSNHYSKKQPRKGDYPIRVTSYVEDSQEYLPKKNLICKNSACRAVLATEDTFCKRCSCCICHIFDDNKDPSLWLVCTSDPGYKDSCGLSCHIECALQNQKVGVVSVGHYLQLDGSYCCASCGKIIGIIECWKKQLVIARDARRVDVLCHRISISYRLLDGTTRFKEMHEIVRDAKSKLETEIGAVNGVSSKMARGIVSRLSIASDVQKLCSLAIEKADEWLKSVNANSTYREDSLPAACKFQFEDVTAFSLAIILKEIGPLTSHSIKGYKLWHWKSKERPQQNEPVIFPTTRQRILISNLQPCTEYTFCIISFTEKGDFGHSIAKCFTRSVEIIPKSLVDNCFTERGSSSSKRKAKVTSSSCSSGFKVRELGRVLHRAWAEEHGNLDGFCSKGLEDESNGGISVTKLGNSKEEQPRSIISQEFDLNMLSVPDLNAEIFPPEECFRNDVNCCTSDKKKRTARSSGSGSSVADRPAGDVSAVESQSKVRRRKAMSMTEDCDSTVVFGSPLRLSNKSSGKLDDHYEFCVKVIRWLECRGHIEKDFRMKFLTWFSLRSTEQERRVVHTFIITLVDDPRSLAGQLVDSFLEIILCKRPGNSFCSKLWH